MSKAYTNSHASVRVEKNEAAAVGGQSFTDRRDDDFEAFIRTESNNTTSFEVRTGQTVLSLTGRQARTMQRLLNKHYSTCGASYEVPGLE